MRGAQTRHFISITFNLTTALPHRFCWLHFQDGEARFREIKGNGAKFKVIQLEHGGGGRTPNREPLSLNSSNHMGLFPAGSQTFGHTELCPPLRELVGEHHAPAPQVRTPKPVTDSDPGPHIPNSSLPLKGTVDKGQLGCHWHMAPRKILLPQPRQTPLSL